MSIGILYKLARGVPRYGRLVYCLFRDPRTPRWWKMGVSAALFVVWVPFIPLDFIPVIGQMEWVGLTLLTLRFAVGRAPRELVEEHKAAIATGTSLFHRDFGRLRNRADFGSTTEYKAIEKR
ncbi:MAG: hypothetical protein M3010_08535 [Candidatus Dormibacteraeota bacterium]|nr:hypothetical protein [Candidatus Dormibacteraeota bacterium]